MNFKEGFLWYINMIHLRNVPVLPHGLMVKTSASHDGSTDSNPVAGAPS